MPNLLEAWQACNTLSALLISPLLSFTSASVASGRILTFSSSITLSTNTLISASFNGLNLNRVHLDSSAGDSLCE